MSNKVTFPKIGAKHTFTPLFTAKHTMKWQERLPRKVILIYSKEALQKKLKSVLKLSDYKHKLGSGGGYLAEKLITKDRKLLIINLPLGSPFTAMVAEEAIACGAKEFLIIGCAGALSKKLMISDIVLCTSSIRDEGTSHHYLPDSKFAYPNPILTKKLKSALIDQKLKFVSGSTWTIDAVYAETRDEVKHYRDLGVLTVEMEASALFAVAKKRKVKAAAVFTISDKLDDEWTGFVSDFKETGYKRLAQVAKIFKELKV